MKTWEGAAAVCLNKNREILLVLQGIPEEVKKWAIPSGQREGEESFEECCVREVFEETGYHVRVVRRIFQKEDVVDGYNVVVPYFLVEITGGTLCVNDPDKVIHDVHWVSVAALDELDFSYPGDKKFLREFVPPAC